VSFTPAPIAMALAAIARADAAAARADALMVKMIAFNATWKPTSQMRSELAAAQAEFDAQIEGLRRELAEAHTCLRELRAAIAARYNAQQQLIELHARGRSRAMAVERDLSQPLH
jgi:hypothetical protein